MHRIIGVIIIILGMLLMGCEKQTSPDTLGVTEELSTFVTEANRSTWDENLYFSCVASDGIAAFSLTWLIYQQPLIEKNVVFDYVVYEDESKLVYALEDERKSVVILEMMDAIEVLRENEDYALVGLGRYIDADDQTSKITAVLMNQSVLEVYPTVAMGFMTQYDEGVQWLMMDAKRAEAYAKQLEIQADNGTYTLFTTVEGTDALLEFINTLEMDDNDREVTIERIMPLNEGGKP